MKARTRFPVWLWGVAALALAALACDPPPVTGITCLRQRDDGTIIAPEDANSYTSTDGGLTWRENGLDPNPAEACPQSETARDPWTQTDPTNPDVKYRFTPELSIERSGDGGASWHKEVDLSGTEARTIYYLRSRYNAWSFRPGPLDALADSKTGNLVVAMGYEGVLVRSPQGHWTWVTVGTYGRTDMRDLSITLPLISQELALALVIGVLTLCGLPVFSRRKNLLLVMGSVLASLLAAALVLGAYVGIEAVLMALSFSAYLVVSQILQAIMVILIPVALLATPPLIAGWVATRTHQEEKLALIWAAMSWTYLTLYLIVTNIDWPLGWGEGTQSPAVIVGALIVMAISGFVLLWGRFERRTLILSAWFGLSGMLVVDACYFLWGIGGIPFHLWATLWAVGLTLANLAVGAVVIRRREEPAESHMEPA